MNMEAAGSMMSMEYVENMKKTAAVAVWIAPVKKQRNKAPASKSIIQRNYRDK